MIDFQSDYSIWRENSLQAWQNCTPLAAIKLKNPYQPSAHELRQLADQCQATNFAIYQLESEHNNRATIHHLARQFGMARFEHDESNETISELRNNPTQGDLSSAYIPYTDNKLNWHTDGYYNRFEQHIRSFLLHCHQPALSGGENMILNHELIYIALHDEDPQLTQALMQNDVLTIPANVQDDIEIRPAQTGPVFYRDPRSQRLQMRYTARTRSIVWKQNALIEHAVQRIQVLLKQQNVIRYTLQAGQGLICNNILHGRSAFTDGNIPDQQRLLYRVRSYDRLFDHITDTYT